MSKSLSILVSALLIVVGTTGLSLAQGLSCGPGVSYDLGDSDISDKIVFISATCMKSMVLGPVSAGGHLAYGFGNYDTNSNIVDGSYTSFRAGVILQYPITVSEESSIQPHVFAAPGVLTWSEDCDFSDCSDTELIVDVGGGATLNDQFVAEVYAIAGGSMEFGGRLRAMFPIGGN